MVPAPSKVQIRCGLTRAARSGSEKPAFAWAITCSGSFGSAITTALWQGLLEFLQPLVRDLGLVEVYLLEVLKFLEFFQPCIGHFGGSENENLEVLKNRRKK